MGNLFKKMMLCIFVLLLFFIMPGYAKNTLLQGFPSGKKFSRVFFFGDSLSDVGNNQDHAMDQAPDTNKSKKDGVYKDGATWAVFFLQELKNAGMLEASATTNIIPSKEFDHGPVPATYDSIDFAYSGDPSNGYPLTSTGHRIQYHPLSTENGGCIFSVTGSLPNALCGVSNRVRDFVQRGNVDPNALYVIWVGANDIQQQLSPSLEKAILDPNVKIDPQHPPGEQQAQKTILSTVNSIDNSILFLAAYGAKNFVVINLPNLGYTPMGYFLNQLYYMIRDPHGQKPATGTIVNDVFTNLTNGFNNILRNGYPGVGAIGLDKLASQLHVTIIQPDISQLFDLARSYKLVDFPESSAIVNRETVMSWMSLCCYNYYRDSSDPTHKFDMQYRYEPSHCTISTNPLTHDLAAYVCNGTQDYGDSPKLPANYGHYLFFNDIHPTTCTGRYIAKFVLAATKGVGFIPPKQSICDVS